MKTDECPLGLYVHVPFCRSKCPYCDFYSFAAGKDVQKKYAAAVCALVEATGCRFDSVYFGGGTPSILGSELLSDILLSAAKTDGCETTLECNPSDVFENYTSADFERLAECGVNRVSMGLQSADDGERRVLGRRAGKNEVSAAIEKIRVAGIDNISLDLMLGIPGQTGDTLKKSVDFCAASGAKHVSAYLLKIEEGTEFFKRRSTLDLPDEDESAEIYLLACELLERAGFHQYEISNFANMGFESRHNLKYWHCEEYLGIGPAAHSFYNGKRFYYERSLDAFMSGNQPLPDGEGGNFEEYAMLALRLSEGLTEERTVKRFGCKIPQSIRENAEKPELAGLLFSDERGVRLTPQGFLLSNSVIGKLLL